MSQLILTEKPSVARDIAKVLKVTQKKEGYFYGNGYIITWAFGHLIQLVHAQHYNAEYKSWDLAHLPIIPEPFQTDILGDDGVKAQFNTISKLMTHSDVTDIICATDAGREGELIFRLIYEKSGTDKPIKRLWISSQTEKAIKEGFENLKPGKDYDTLFDSALSRSEADWLIGINATRAYTRKFSYGNGVMSVGRVQTPVLNMIVNRYTANINFVPETYYEIEATIQHKNGSYNALWMNDKKESRLTSKEAAEKITQTVQNSPHGIIKSINKKEVSEKPPLLYDLTEVQKDANRQFKMSADDTLKTMQALYEKHKILTYPRTSSRYLSDDLKPKIKGLMQNIQDLDIAKPYVNELLEKPIKYEKRIFDDKKVTDHHAIIPTDQKPNVALLSPIERKLYELVIKRFIAGFMDECEKEQSEIMTTIATEDFRTSGTIIRKIGWRAVYDNAPAEEENNSKRKSKKSAEKKEIILPTVSENDPVTSKKIDAKEKQTKAPPLHNEASILAAMETAGKTIDDEELRQSMKDCGLGTPATRAQILERLIKVGYIERQKTSLLPTQKGIQLIELILDEELLSPELTGEMEKKLNQIVNGDYSRAKYMSEIKDFANKIINNIKTTTKEAPYIPKNPIGNCPTCKTGLVSESKKAFGCSNWKNKGCKFVIWKTIAGKEITESMAKKLLKNGKTQQLKGFKSRAGKDFDAALKLDNDKVVFEFDNTQKP